MSSQSYSDVLRDARRDATKWRNVALLLAEYHAATAETSAFLKRTSGSERIRQLGICETAKDLIEGSFAPRARNLDQFSEAVVKRLGSVVDQLEDLVE